MTDASVHAEDEANEARTVRKTNDGRKPSIVDVVEDAVATFAKPLSQERLTEKDLEERREANDEEQRRPANR